MQLTRRYWTAVGLAGLLAGAAVVLASPLLLVGAGVLAAWLVVQQALFVRAVVRTGDALAVGQSLSRDQVAVDDEVTVALDASLSELASGVASSPVGVEVTANPPVGASAPAASDRRLLLDGNGGETTTFTVEWPTAGEFAFGRPTVTVTDARGLFASTFPADAPRPTATVVPRRPDDVHVGEGGDPVASAFGDHKTGDFGEGLDPGGVREYVPGDSLRQIDWKATARSPAPHVREFEEETDRRTAVVLDHRGAMAAGPPGETELDYARQVALGFVAHARAERDPLGFYAVGDEGVTERFPPDDSPGSYATVRTALHDLEPTAPARTPDGSRTDDPVRDDTPATPRDAARKADRLRDDDSAFATGLRPFLGASRTYVQRVTGDPLYDAVRAQLEGMEGTVTAVVITDDRNRAEVREAVELARRRAAAVVVVLAPAVLFEPAGLADVAAAYDRYADFEAFRRDLAGLDRVAALELAPGDRLDALLAAERTARATRERGT